MVHDLTKKNLADIIESSKKPVVIDVYAPWCGPCVQIKPLFTQLATELSDTYTFAQMNVDEERDLAIQYSITSIPTFLFIKNNQVVGRETGYMSKDALKDKLKAYLG